ncbi:MAG: SurA N-terminal domain-containing protein [Nitrospirae bacterium]|nr:SurA N-terminal domain-containing protein [Nitrospirota bacterium]
MNLAILGRFDKTRKFFKRFELSIISCFFFLISLFSFFPFSEAKVVDRVAAVVNNRVITLSTLNAATELRKADIQIEEDISDEDLIREKILRELIDRSLIINEAEKFGMTKLPDAEITEALEEIKKAYPTEVEFEKALSRWGMNTEDLRLYIKEQITALKFIDQRIRFFVKISDEEIDKFYKEKKSSFGNKSLDEVKEEIEVYLTEEEVARQLEEYVKKIRAKAEIRINIGH